MRSKTKILAAIAFALVLLLAFAGCGDGKSDTEGENAATAPSLNDSSAAASAGAEETAIQKTTFGFSRNAKQLVPGMAMAEVLAVTGEAKDIFESPSCAFNGTDRIYYFTGFDLNSYPDERGTERLLSVVLKDDSVQTDEGLYLGMTEDETLAIYGKGVESDAGSEIDWTNGDLVLRTVFTDGKATGISIHYMPAQQLVDEQALAQ